MELTSAFQMTLYTVSTYRELIDLYNDSLGQNSYMLFSINDAERISDRLSESILVNLHVSKEWKTSLV